MQITGVRSGIFPQSKLVESVKVGVVSRLAYVDIIRMVLMVLVIMVHAAVTYGGFGDWTYTNPGQEDDLTVILLSLLVILCQSFFMSLFFFFSGHFTPGSYDRKGVGQFCKDRLLRLAIPMLAYTLFLSRVPNYIDEVGNDGLQMSFWQYTRLTFWADADSGPTWFLFALLVFAAGYILWRLITKITGDKQMSWMNHLPVPEKKHLLGVSLLMGIAMFATSQLIPIPEAIRIFDGAIPLIVCFFPFYILMFVGGILAYRNNWLAQLPGKDLRFWSWLSLGLVVALPVLLFLGGFDSRMGEFFSGLNWRCALTSLWFGLACITFSMALTLWARERVQPNNRLAAFMGPNTFGIYLVHPLVLVPITFALSFVGMHPLIKFIVASISTVAVCAFCSEGLRRVPGLKYIL